MRTVAKRPLFSHIAVLLPLISFFIFTFGTPVLLVYLWRKVSPYAAVALLTYIAWGKWFDEAPKDGSRSKRWLRSNWYWTLFGKYFPTKVVLEDAFKTHVNDPSKRPCYLFAIHPHGIIGMSVWGNLIADSSGLTKLAPRLDLRIITLPVNFIVPFWREFLLGVGFIESHASSIHKTLEADRSVGIVIGGAIEALDAMPNVDYKAKIKSRKGFVKAALRNGVPIVPVFCFGENDLYDQHTGPTIKKIQTAFKQRFTWTWPLVKFQGWLGVLPNYVPLTTVIGAPLELPHVPHPSDEQVHHYHALYIQHLTRLFEEHKASCDPTLTTRQLVLW